MQTLPTLLACFSNMGKPNGFKEKQEEAGLSQTLYNPTFPKY